ncbi:dipeptide/oligopeptide/nickel ABC transporter permease/ATP-binding protein [Microbacterium sp. NPDC089695]|uniref:dipeptide/oligopeptide/nickel ABC transporter permease/ATP-binding protein n=1 Tax=Microbacterium sp. NPDC089695 TaxID=3364198 RepID=UPI0038021C30
MTGIELTPVDSPATIRTHGVLRRLLRQPVAVVSGIAIVLVIAACAAAPLLAPAGPLAQNLTEVYALPSAAHLLGTDQLGRDILTRLLYGGQVTLVGALQAVLVFTIVGVIAGVVAGSRPGLVDAAIMRVVDLIQSVPGLIVLLVILAIFTGNESAAMLTLGVLVAPGLTRVVRGAIIDVRHEQFVAAARVAGLSALQVQIRHLLPAVVGPVLTQVSVLAGAAILIEASISFLGLGVPAPYPTWGNLIKDAQLAIGIAPWMLVPTGGAVTLVSLALTLLGSGIRAAYAGRTSRQRGELSWRTLAADVEETTPGSSAAAEALLDVDDMRIEVIGDSGAVTIVDGVSFSLARGESLGLVGESGCGKSMTVSGLTRVLPPGATLRAGRMTFDGQDLLSLSERRMQSVRGTGIAYISQEPISSLDPVYTAGQQIAEAVRVHRGVSRREAKAIALELLAQVRLPDPAEVARKYPHELSGGMAQRIAIARALAGRPALLIADEPTTALDVTVQAEILDLMRELRETTGMAMIIVTHDWGVLADSCDRALVMYAGQVVERADIRALTRHPSHPYSAALLASDLSEAVPGERLRTIPGTVPPPTAWSSACRFAPRCAFATAACTDAPVPVVVLPSGQESRCIHVDELMTEEARDERRSA